MYKIVLISLTVFSIIVFESFNKKDNKTEKPIGSTSVQDSISFIKDRPIAFVGDLQRTTNWELMIGREQNERERQKIIQSISSQNPSALVLLGDMVSNGSDLKEWNYLDKLLNPIQKKKIPILPVLGNHEYWGNNSIALMNAGEFFPIFRTSHWYTMKYGNLILIVLDSNRHDLLEEGWSEQRNWFENRLKYYDSDSSVKGIIVCLHHPPFTNSLVTGDNIDVQEAFVQPFLDSQKTLLFLSGHAHTYERFNEKGKMFVVSGGGGGPRVILKTGLNVHKDLVNLPSLRPFNYLLLNLKPDGIEITAKGLDKGTSNFYTIDKFSIQFFSLSY